MTRGFRRESCVRGVATSTRKVATVEGTVQKDATGREQAWDGLPLQKPRSPLPSLEHKNRAALFGNGGENCYVWACVEP